jgi:hypothetical protein
VSNTAIVVFSDPKAGTEEALGRVVNAMILALELKEKNQAVVLIFQGSATRWAATLNEPNHFAHDLFEAVRDKLIVCGGCADVFGATAGAETVGAKLVREKYLPGIEGVVDLSNYLDKDYRLVTF